MKWDSQASKLILSDFSHALGIPMLSRKVSSKKEDSQKHNSFQTLSAEKSIGAHRLSALELDIYDPR